MNHEDEISFRWGYTDYFHTYGGEYWDDDYYVDSYGLDFSGKFSIDEIPSTSMCDIGLKIINHLMAAGHRFEIKKDYNGEYLHLIK